MDRCSVTSQPLLPKWEWGVDLYGFNDKELSPDKVAGNMISLVHELAGAGFDLKNP